jgi:lysine-specific permease
VSQKPGEEYSARGPSGLLAYPAVLCVRDPDYQPDHSVHDPSLLRNDVKDISVSPFTLVFQHAGLLSAAAVMNAVILTAVLSAGNSGMYASTRMLYTLACDGKAPRIFAKLSRGGVPRNALYATTVIAGLCFLTSMFGNQTVYLWLLNTSGMTGFIAWLGIAISHYRFRRGFVKQGHDVNAAVSLRFFPLGPIFAFILCLIITLGQNYEAFLADTIDWGAVTATYIGIPLFLVIWFGYKLTKGTTSFATVKWNSRNDLNNNRTSSLLTRSFERVFFRILKQRYIS